MNVQNNSFINNDTSNLSNSSKRKPNIWSKEEDAILIEKSKEYGYKNWAAVASFIKGRSAIQCSARYKRIQPGLIKGAWTPEEDQELLRLYKYYGKNWSNISKSMPQRTGKQIRDRFLNALDDNLKKDKFSIEEDRKVVKWYKVYGNAWCRIAKKIKGRTGDMVKNRFYSSLKNHLDDFDEEEENTKEGRKKRRYKKRKSTKKEITGKRTKRQYTRKKKVNSDETDVTNQNYNNEQDNKISISTSNTSNNTMNNVLFSTTAEPFQEVIKPLPTNDAMLISSKTIGEDKTITGFNNHNKIPFILNTSTNNIKVPNNISLSLQKPIIPPQNKTIPLLRRNSSAIIRMQSSIDTTNYNNIDDYDNSFVISDRKFDKGNSVLKYRNDSLTEENNKINDIDIAFQSKTELLKSLINTQMVSGVKPDNLLSQLKVLEELRSLTKDKINAITQNK